MSSVNAKTWELLELVLIIPHHHITQRTGVQAEAQTSQRWEDDCLIRGVPLGSDRRRNRYWRFLGSGVGSDGTSGRVFFESNEDGSFRCACVEASLAREPASRWRSGPG